MKHVDNNPDDEGTQNPSYRQTNSHGSSPICIMNINKRPYVLTKILTNYLSEFDVRITISSWLYCFQELILFLKGRNINLLRPNINFFLDVSGYIEGIPGVIYVLTSTNSVEMKSVELIGLDQFFSPTSSDGEPSRRKARSDCSRNHPKRERFRFLTQIKHSTQ